METLFQYADMIKTIKALRDRRRRKWILRMVAPSAEGKSLNLHCLCVEAYAWIYSGSTPEKGKPKRLSYRWQYRDK